MKKAAELRRHLLESVADLGANPDRLIVRIPKGSIGCRAGSLSFAYAYDVEIIVTDFAAHADTLILPVLAWLAVQQPELLQADAPPIAFEAEIVDHERADVQLTVALTERVVVRALDGALVATHCDETPPADGVPPPWWPLAADGTPLAFVFGGIEAAQ